METMACSMEIQKCSHKALTLTGNYYCKSSITNTWPVSENKAILLPLKHKPSIVLPPGSTAVYRQMMSHTAKL